MNTIPRKFLLILMDLGLSLLFLVIILVAVLDFNSRLKHEESQVRGPGAGSGTTAGSLGQVPPQKGSPSSPTDKKQAELQDLWEKNAALATELRKKTTEARTLLEDNMALLGQNASLLARLNQEESQATTHVKLPPAPEGSPAGQHPGGEPPQAQALRQENATLNAQLAQMNATLQRLQQQKAAQPDATPGTAAGQKDPASPGDKPVTQTAQAADKPSESGFWDKMVATFQDAPKEGAKTETAKKEAVAAPADTVEKNTAVAALSPPTQANKTEKTSVVTAPPPPAREEKTEKRPSTASLSPPAREEKEQGRATPPPVKVEKGMVGAGVMDKWTTAFQESAPAAPPTPAAQPPSAGSKPTPAPSPPPPARGEKEGGVTPAAPPVKTATKESPAAPVPSVGKQADKTTPPGVAPDREDKEKSEPGFWGKLLGSKQPEGKQATPSKEAPAVPVAKGTTEGPAPAPPAAKGTATESPAPAPSVAKGTAESPSPAAPISQAARTEPVKPVSPPPREGGWEDLLTAFQGTRSAPATSPSREAGPSAPTARGAEDPVAAVRAPAPPETVLAAVAPAVPTASTTGAPPKKPVTTPPSADGPVLPAPGPSTTPVAPIKGTPADPTPGGTPPARGLPADQAKVVLESPTGGARPQPVSAADLSAARAALMHQIRDDLKKRQIPAEVNEQEGTLYLPGLLEFKGDTPDISPEKRPGMRELATVLARHLPCFSQSAGQVAGCAEVPAAVKLDALVLVGNSGPAPVGSSAFRHNWNQANARALQTFSELLESQPQLNEMRNTYEQSLFRLDGFIPPEKSAAATAKPARRVELRFIMGPASPASRPQQ